MTMSNTIHNELAALAEEFSAQRQSGNKKRFSEIIWEKAVALARQSSIEEVSQAIKVSSAYLKRKMALLASSDSAMTFIELPSPKHDYSHTVKINFESSAGHKMIIDGINSSAVVPLLTEFLKEGGFSCFK
jgi:hypothetical protein